MNGVFCDVTSLGNDYKKCSARFEAKPGQKVVVIRGDLGESRRMEREMIIYI